MSVVTKQLPESESSGHSFLSIVVAGLVLVLAGWFLLHFLIHIAVFLASIVVVVVAVIAVIWALRVLL
jgi:hypothetical protein